MIRKENSLRLALGFLLLGSVGAAAQAPQTSPDAARAAQAMRNFAICAANRSPAGARRLLALTRTDPAYGQTLRRFSRGHNDCAPGSTLRFDGLLLRGGLAEALLRGPADNGRLAGLVAHDPALPAVAAENETDAMALCTVREAPAAIEALLASQPGTVAEDGAARLLGRALSTCLAAGQRLQVNRIGLRALLAVAAYRLVEHRRAAGVVASTR